MQVISCESSDLGIKRGCVKLLINDPSLPWFMAHPWSENYHHWMMDCFSDVWFLKKHGITNPAVALKNEQASKYIDESISLLGLSRSVCPYNLMDWILCEFNVVVSPYRHTSIMHPMIVNGWNSAAPKTEKTNDVLIVVRANPDGPHADKSRNIRNIDKLESALRPLTVKRAVFETLKVSEQALAVASSRAVIGSHGAGLTNLVFASPGTPVVEVKSPLFWQQPYRNISEVLGLKYLLTTGELNEQTKDLYRHSLTVNTSQIAEFVKSNI